MKIIDFEQIKEMNISPRECYDLVTRMIKEKQRAILPPKISMKPAEGVFCNVMPVMIEGEKGEIDKVGGVKVVTRYPERQPSLDSKILLYNFDNGELLAVMDGNFITAMRTGAVAVHSIVNFAKKDFATIGVMGLGNVARATLATLESVYPGRELTIKLLRYKKQAEDFVNRFREYENIHFEIVDTVEELAQGTDIVISAVTYLENDICDEKSFEAGTLLLPIHTRGFSSCDLCFDKVYADDTGHVEHFKYFDKFKFFAETTEVVNGKMRGRENDEERILVYNIGVAMHDINIAYDIYKKMKNRKDILDINMHEANEKFWI